MLIHNALQNCENKIIKSIDIMEIVGIVVAFE
jgi:hypothetical protein